MFSISFGAFRFAFLAAAGSIWRGHCVVARQRRRLPHFRKCRVHLRSRNRLSKSGAGNDVVDVAVFISHWGLRLDVVPLFGFLQVRLGSRVRSCLLPFRHLTCLVYFDSHFWPSLPIAANMAGMSHMLMSSPVFWFGLILAPVTALLSDFSIKT